MQESIILILITIAIVALVDYIPRAFLLVKKAIKVTPSYTPTPKYLIMPTVYGDISYLQNINYLKKYSSKVLICTSKYESQKFYSDLRKICRKHGFRYIKADVPVVKDIPIKNAYTIYSGAFKNLNRLGVSKQTPCLLMDADTYALENTNNLMRTFAASNLDIASLRCEAATPKKIIERLQAFEYTMAMDNRSMDPWLTSGACNMASAGTYQNIFSLHSNFFAGGDIEIGKIASVMGYRVGHIDYTFYTAVPGTIREWYNQRKIWFAGGYRHHVMNIASFGWHHFFMLFYNSLLIYLLLPLRWIEFVNFPYTMLALIILSWIYTAILCVGKGWHISYLLLPFYSAAQSMIIMPIAIGKYIRIAWIQKSFGFLKYDFSSKSFSTKAAFRFLNYSSAAFVIIAAISFTSFRIDYWEENGYFSKYVKSLAVNPWQ